MNEPKRRGRPPKARIPALEQPMTPFVDDAGGVHLASTAAEIKAECLNHVMAEMIALPVVETPAGALADAEAKMRAAKPLFTQEQREKVRANAPSHLFQGPDVEVPNLSQAYANRVWSGQSIDLTRKERLERVMAALKGQKLPTEGVVLP